MFANTQMMGVDVGWPEVQVPPSPAPMPNFASSISHIPAAINTVIGGGVSALGGFNPLSFLSMMGGGEPDTAPAASGPAAPALGASMLPAHYRVLMGG
jgi:hypothetical protein